VIPRHGVHEVPFQLDNDEDECINEYSDISESHGHNYNTKGSNAFSGFSAKRGIQVKQSRVYSREKKRVG